MKKLISVVLAFALITCGVVYYTNENNAYAVSASSNEKQLLARAVNGEARGEPYEGQVCRCGSYFKSCTSIRHSLTQFRVLSISRVHLRRSVTDK